MIYNRKIAICSWFAPPATGIQLNIRAGPTFPVLVRTVPRIYNYMCSGSVVIFTYLAGMFVCLYLKMAEPIWPTFFVEAKHMTPGLWMVKIENFTWKRCRLFKIRKLKQKTASTMRKAAWKAKLSLKKGRLSWKL